MNRLYPYLSVCICILAGLLIGLSGKAQAAPEVAYETEIVGDMPDDLLALLEQHSVLLSRQEQPPQSFAALRSRMNNEKERLAMVLQAEGYYAYAIDSSLDRATDPVAVTVTVTPGPRFTLANYQITYPAESQAPQPSLPEMGLELGAAARSEIFLSAESFLINWLKERGYPFAEIEEKSYSADHSTDEFRAHLSVLPGPFARFGEITYKGLKRVEAAYVQRLFDWPEGETYDRRVLTELRKALSNANLFESIVLEPAETVDAQGRLPLVVNLDERKHRTLGFSLGYATDEGVNGRAFWEHRNLWGQGEVLRTDLFASMLRQGAEIGLRKPHAPLKNGALLARGHFINETSDAFEGQSAAIFGGYEHAFTPFLSASAGGEIEYSRLDAGVDEEQENAVVFALPASLNYDTRNDRLDPTRGWLVSAGVTPFLVTGSDRGTFLDTQLSAGGYWGFFDNDRVVLAGRAGLGNIAGGSLEAIPANRRLYSGGGGSVRGFAFRTIGPLDAKEDPTGGRARAELNLETRIKITDSIGIVPFIDGGAVSEENLGNFEGKMRWAAGIGARYYSPIGPIRLDLAVPLNRRDSDSSFQFYISLGQAF